MPHPKDDQRIAAFTRWTRHVGIDRARDLAGLNPRTFQRICARRQPPPVRLLEELAEGCDDRAIADMLRAAAAPMERDHA